MPPKARAISTTCWPRCSRPRAARHHPVAEPDPLHAGLVRAGIGAALVPEAAMSLHFDDVHFRPVQTQPTAPVELFAAWRSENDNPALAAFLDLLRPESAHLDEA